MSLIKNKSANQNGLALILVVLVLANLFIITLIVTDIVLRIGRSSYQIGQSEVAYLAAETAIEETIYAIEATRSTNSLGTIDYPASNDLTYSDGTENATWSRYVSTATSTLITCVSSSQIFSYPTNPNSGEASNSSCIYAEDKYTNQVNTGSITNSNPLKIRLKPAASFQLDLDFLGVSYPSQINVDCDSPSRPDGEIVILRAGGQIIYDTSSTCGFNISLSNNERVKITNNSSADATYTITPSVERALSVSLVITAKGYFQDKQERIIEVERRNWQIY